MDIGSIFGIVFGVVASIGGIGAIFLFVSQKSYDFLQDKLFEKYKVYEEPEVKPTPDDGKKFISRAKFDAEFQIHRELSLHFSLMIRDLNVMSSRRAVDRDAKKQYGEKLYQSICSSAVKVQSCLFANTAFMPEELYTSYEELLRLCMMQISSLERPNAREEHGRAEEINKKWKAQSSRVREYFDALEVLS